VNKEASHHVRLFGGNKIGNRIFWLPLVLLQYIQFHTVSVLTPVPLCSSCCRWRHIVCNSDVTPFLKSVLPHTSSYRYYNILSHSRNDQQFVPLLYFILCHSILVLIYFPLLSLPTLCYRILHFTFLPPCTCSLYYTFLPYFNLLHILLLLCHSTCFILHKMLYIIILLSVIYFRYSTHSICIWSNSEGTKMMAGYCRNMYEPVRIIKWWYKSVHSVCHLYYV
jgi:hypothetical protein